LKLTYTKSVKACVPKSGPHHGKTLPKFGKIRLKGREKKKAAERLSKKFTAQSIVAVCAHKVSEMEYKGAGLSKKKKKGGRNTIRKTGKKHVRKKTNSGLNTSIISLTKLRGKKESKGEMNETTPPHRGVVHHGWKEGPLARKAVKQKTDGPDRNVVDFHDNQRTQGERFRPRKKPRSALVAFNTC